MYELTIKNLFVKRTHLTDFEESRDKNWTKEVKVDHPPFDVLSYQDLDFSLSNYNFS